MSSAPQPLSSNVAAAPLSAPSFFAPQGVDYGPVGKVPSGPGVHYFAEKSASSKLFLIIVSLFAAGLLLVGAVSLMVGGILIGLGILIVAALIFWGVWRSVTGHMRTDLVCDASGVTLRQGSRKTGLLPPVHIPWATVSATQCGVKVGQNQNSDNGVSTNTYTQTFAIHAASGAPVQTTESKLKGFHSFIEVCNASTPQLPYQWVSGRSAKGMPVLATEGTYVMIAR